MSAMSTSVLVLGAGFGGLELSSRLSSELGDLVDVMLIDREDAFVFGFSKLDVMFGRRSPESVRIAYRDLAHQSVRFSQETITAIDPIGRRVETDRGAHEADVLVVALGAEYDIDATPGLAQVGHEFYSVAGAASLGEVLPDFRSGTAVVGVCGTPFKCPPAPSEAALLLDENLRERGVRDRVRIQVVIPFGTPVPPSPGMSEAILERFTQQDIEFIPARRVAELDPEHRQAVLDDGSRLPFDLFLGVPVHRAPGVVTASALAEEGWIPVDRATLATRFPGVYAVGDVTSVGTPKAGVFAERAARVVADQLIARIRGDTLPPGYDGTGSCWIELGGHQVGRVDVDFFFTPGQPTGTYTAPSALTADEKAVFATTRRARWFDAAPER
jgi:sulfide:quinone oxidoreductase